MPHPNHDFLLTVFSLKCLVYVLFILNTKQPLPLQIWKCLFTNN